MFSHIRKRVTYANVAATIAVLFAMTGGALAASKYIITSTKQIKPSVLAQIKGKNGAPGKDGTPGAQGPQGSAGPAGAPGAKGNDGSNGAEGKVGPTGPTGKSGTNGINGTNGTTGPTGPTGATGPTAMILPSGQTETGVWSASQRSIVEPSQRIWVPISFPIRLPAESAAKKAFYFNQEQTEEEEFGTSGCTGSLNEPKAPPGTLCVYTGPESLQELKEMGVFKIEGSFETYGKSGAILEFRTEATTSNVKPAKIEASGSWAVTAP